MPYDIGVDLAKYKEIVSKKYPRNRIILKEYCREYRIASTNAWFLNLSYDRMRRDSIDNLQ
jgi:hypothetical protein